MQDKNLETESGKEEADVGDYYNHNYINNRAAKIYLAARLLFNEKLMQDEN